MSDQNQDPLTETPEEESLSTSSPTEIGPAETGESSNAFARFWSRVQEMGITNRFLPFDNDPNGIDPPELAGCDTVPDDPTGMTYEDNLDLGNGVDREFIDVVTDFQRFMVPPPQTPRSGMAGEALFAQIGCADCHVPTFVTADDPGLEDVLRNREIHPYSDFLLHDMGLNADGIAQGDATIRELKTPPLWGLRLRPELWHDGRFGVRSRGQQGEVILALVL